MGWVDVCCFGCTCIELWQKVVVRKWLNMGTVDSDYDADTDNEFDHDVDYLYDAEDSFPRLSRQNSETFRAQYISEKDLRVFVGTWNVGGIGPPDDLDIEEWLNISEPADIYVLGLEEIVPLNAGNIFGVEDNRPVLKWENIIRETLGRVQPAQTTDKSYSVPPSPSKFKPLEDVADLEDENPSGLYEFKDITTIGDDISKDDVVSEGCEIPLLGSLKKLERLPSSGPDLESLIQKRRPKYVRIVSKQMVGIFLTIWVRRHLRKHIQNLKVSTVGVGVMGYIGNKGSVSVSMSMYQTLFCFICTHLTSGDKEVDQLKRNADVFEIHRRTVFRSDSDLLPKSIQDHEKIFWLGDLNYRIHLPYEKTRQLIFLEDWSQLVENDELVREMKNGNVFNGWSEGILNFPPTYKYELNSASYSGGDPKAVNRRTPAWCDRILSFGEGIKLLEYRRSELKLSDHRPVNAIYDVGVEVFSLEKLQRVLTLTTTEKKRIDFFNDGAPIL